VHLADSGLIHTIELMAGPQTRADDQLTRLESALLDVAEGFRPPTEGNQPASGTGIAQAGPAVPKPIPGTQWRPLVDNPNGMPAIDETIGCSDRASDSAGDPASRQDECDFHTFTFSRAKT
jgi:hypothetical protein